MLLVSLLTVASADPPPEGSVPTVSDLAAAEAFEPVGEVEPAAETGPVRYVKAKELNLRWGPGEGAAPVTTLRWRDEVKLLDDRGEWCRVTTGKEDGYVACRYLSKSKPSATSPKAAQPSSPPPSTSPPSAWSRLGGPLACVVSCGLFGVLLWTLFNGTARPWVCELCGNQLRRRWWTWTLEGEEKVVCPECNATLRRRNSRRFTR